MRHLLALAALPLLAAGCNGSTDKSMAAENPDSAIGTPQAGSSSSSGPQNAAQMSKVAKLPFDVETVANLDEPWAMTFLGAGEALITEKDGRLLHWTQNGGTQQVTGTPKVDYGGQGGLGDVVLAPDFAQSGMVYLSWVEAGDGDTRGAVVGRAKLNRTGAPPSLDNLQIVWRQAPKVTGRGHFSHRIAFSPDGKYMFISSGERQKQDPAQDRSNNLGSIVRLYPDGSVPEDNPFYSEGGTTAQIWSYGHRNTLGLAFSPNGQLWNHEMGPKGGDEVNLIKRGANYGWPVRSYGDNYDGKPIPDHSADDGFTKPKVYWTPVISPAGMIFYTGSLFPEWQGSILMGGLSSKSLALIDVNDQDARQETWFDMGTRIREVEQAPDGSVWLLEDGGKSAQGRVMRLTPKSTS